MNIAKFLRTAFFIEHVQLLILSPINAKRYRNDLSWLRSSVFTVNFEHISQFRGDFNVIPQKFKRLFFPRMLQNILA